MELSIADITRDAIDKTNSIFVLESAIDFSEALLTSDVSDDGRLLAVLENKGLVEVIDRMTDHNNRDVFKKAELFMDVVRVEQLKQQKSV